MRVAIECKSPLLQKSLELFLKQHLSPIRSADIIIRDTKNSDRNFYISQESDADLIKPFSKSQLLLALEARYRSLNKEQIIKNYTDEPNLDFEILQRRIESLTKEYQDGIIKAIKAFYEK
ncbi:MAG: hypothetical protein WC144_04040 [Sulfurimonas sp.]|nr:hypothetical protein [Sulfurimonadaceae bacterium]